MPLLIPAAFGYRGAPADLPGRDHADLAVRGPVHLGDLRLAGERHAAARLRRHRHPAGGARHPGRARARLRAPAAAACRRRARSSAVLTIPGTAFLMHVVAGLAAPTPGNANFITADERAALRYSPATRRRAPCSRASTSGSRSPAPPAGARYVGDCLWSEPECLSRALSRSAAVVGHDLEGEAARLRALDRRPVRAPGLQGAADPGRTLAPLTVSIEAVRVRRRVRARCARAADVPSA